MKLHPLDKGYGIVAYIDKNLEKVYEKEELILIKEINWEQRRFELIKAALPAIVSISSENSEAMQSLVNASLFGEKINEEEIERIAERQIISAAQTAIKYADAVIAKLKER